MGLKDGEVEVAPFDYFVATDWWCCSKLTHWCSLFAAPLNDRWLPCPRYGNVKWLRAGIAQTCAFWMGSSRRADFILPKEKKAST